MVLEVGTKAPDFNLYTGDGERVSLSQFLGKKVAVYFYPKDNTPGCTTEACDFRDNFARLTALNTVVIGISCDSVKSHKGFSQKYELPFILLSDDEMKVVSDYGVWQLKKNYGKEYMGIVRSTFIINEQGIIEKVYEKVSVSGHVDEIVNYLSAL